jgi:hypothetical protein
VALAIEPDKHVQLVTLLTTTTGDGSKEWTPEWLTKLGHRFGDDGAFWISYKDLLRKYQTFDRTRLFGPQWRITSIWTTLNVPWSLEYHDTKFSFTLAKAGPVVIVLSQLDTRYFRGLEGQYDFGLGFRVHRAGEDEYLVRNHTTYSMNRSCNVELELEAGEYTLLIRVDANRRDGTLPPEDVVRLNAKERREKLLRIGLAYDLAHGKARIVETAEEKAAREAYAEHQKDKRRNLRRKDIMEKKNMRNYIKRKERATQLKDEAWQRKVKQRRAEKQGAKRQAKRKAAEEEAERREKVEPEGDGRRMDEAKEDAQGEKEHAGKEIPPSGSRGRGETQAGDISVGMKETLRSEREPETEGSNARKDQASESENDESHTKRGASESGRNTSAVGDTPPASASETPASEPAGARRRLDAPEDADEVEEKALAETMPGAAERAMTSSQFEEKVRTALDVMTSFQKELEGLLGKIPDGPPRAVGPASSAMSRPYHLPDRSRWQPSPQIPRGFSGQEYPEPGDMPRLRDPRRSQGPPPPGSQGDHDFPNPEDTPHPHHAQCPPGSPTSARFRGTPPSGNHDSHDSFDSESDSPPQHHQAPPGPPLARGFRGPPQHGGRGTTHPPHPSRFRGPLPRYMPHSAGPSLSPSSDGSDDSDSDLCSIRSASSLSSTELDLILRQDDEINRSRRHDRSPSSQPLAPVPGPFARGGQLPVPMSMVQADEFERDPWNAVAVVGLRIYYKVEGEREGEEGEGDGDDGQEAVKLRVVRPNRWVMDDHDDGGDAEGRDMDVEEETVLDVDDSAKDATVAKEMGMV